MGEPQSLSGNESLSADNWLMNMIKKPAQNADSHPSDISLRSSPDDEMDRLRAPARCSERSSFHFDLSGLGPTDMSVADQMIRNGSLVPLDLIDKQHYEDASNVDDIPESHSAYSVRTRSSNTLEMLRMQHRYATSSHPISPYSSSYSSPYSSPIGSPVDILRASYNRSVDFTGTKSSSHSFDQKKRPSKKINVVKYIKSMVHFCKKVKEIRRALSSRSSDRDRGHAAAVRMKSGCSSPLHDAGREHAIKEAILHCKSSSRKYMENFAVGGDERIKK